MIVLAFDIGNSTVTAGIYRDGALKKTLRLEHGKALTRHALRKKLLSFAGAAGATSGKTDGAVISSVVPRQTRLYRSVVREAFHVRALVVSGSMTPGMKIRYADPSSLGADRVCHAAAALDKYGGP